MIDNNHRLAPMAGEQSRAPGAKGVSATLTALALAIIVNVVVLANVNLPVVRPVLGFWFLIVLPSYLAFTSSLWRKCGLQERWGYSVCLVLLVLMLAGLAVNEVLPLVGVPRALGAGPITIVGDLINVSFYFFRSRHPGEIQPHYFSYQFTKQEFRLLVAAGLTVVLAVFGANHLNNGASGKITEIALAMMALIGVFAIRWLKFTREPVMSVVIYLVSLALLLTTSLRGWYITGHDIQQEFLVFQLTEAHAHWSMVYLHDPYNACLSITILPTELSQIINVDSPYVFKLFFQVVFALCPVLAYAISRRYFNRGISTLSVAYFISFPTFFTDTPFLNRQEIALLFVAVGLLAATNPVWSFRRRQVSLGIAGLATEISHYSTMYVFVGTLVFALLLSYASRLVIKSDAAQSKSRSVRATVQRGGRRWVPTARGAVTIGLVAVFAGVIFAWGTLATKTTNQALNDGTDALAAGSISFSILPGASNTQETTLHDLREEGIQARATAAPGTYLPWSVVSKVATPIVDEPVTPLTSIGSDLNSVGIPVATLNSLAHSLEADCEELFLAVGLVSLFIKGWRRGGIVGGQFYWLSAGCTAMIILITVVPSISADYGVLRAFQQGLLFFSPMIVIGSMTIFSPLGQTWSRISGCVLCLGVFLITTTLVPQILGNNLAQLNLNNSGFYYDLYYKTPQEVAAVSWMDGQPNALRYPIQASWDTRRFLFTGPSVISGSENVTDEYPTLLTKTSWVILDNSTMTSDTAFSFDEGTGNLTEYKYPIGLLNQYKNLVYTDGKAAIYK
jgi:uncharacterized membrane protein